MKNIFIESTKEVNENGEEVFVMKVRKFNKKQIAWMVLGAGVVACLGAAAVRIGSNLKNESEENEDLENETIEPVSETEVIEEDNEL